MVNKIENGCAILAAALGADDDIRKCHSLSLTKGAKDRIEGGETFSDLILPASRMLVCRDNQKLKTSAIWMLRSYLGDRDMDQILASAIAVEVLLGDRETSDRIGLSKLMANRCAYALGKSASERQDIADAFVKWYRLRSEIVHSGRMRVSEDERKVVVGGKRLAARLLNHEILMAT